MSTYSTSVLIVDDNHISLDLLNGILSTLGYANVKRLREGNMALASYQEEKPEVIFLDINMPQKSGLEILQEIHAVEPKAFVVMVSGESSAANIQKSLALGAQGFVVKPYSAARIKDVLDKYQKQSGPR
jgi:two-component system chemotaxis response regulator CheY